MCSKGMHSCQEAMAGHPRSAPVHTLPQQSRRAGEKRGAVALATCPHSRSFPRRRESGRAGRRGAGRSLTPSAPRHPPRRPRNPPPTRPSRQRPLCHRASCQDSIYVLFLHASAADEGGQEVGHRSNRSDVATPTNPPPRAVPPAGTPDAVERWRRAPDSGPTCVTLGRPSERSDKWGASCPDVWSRGRSGPISCRASGPCPGNAVGAMAVLVLRSRSCR